MAASEYGFEGVVRRYDEDSFETALVAETAAVLAAMRVIAAAYNVDFSEVFPRDAASVAEAEARDRAAELCARDEASPDYSDQFAERARTDAQEALVAGGGVVRVRIERKPGEPRPTAFGFTAAVRRLLHEEVAVAL